MKMMQALLLSAAALTISNAALAHGNESHAEKPKAPISAEQKLFGREGAAAARPLARSAWI